MAEYISDVDDISTEDDDDIPAELVEASTGGEEDFEMMTQSMTNKGKRGRPCGYRRHDLAEPATKRVKRNLVPADKLVAYLCCVSVCLSSIPAESLKKARDNFLSMSILQRSKWILEWLTTHIRRPENTAVFLIEGQQVCKKAWMVCLGIPASTFYSIRTKFLDGVKQITGPGNTSGKKTTETQYTLSWLKNLAARYADKMPDSCKDPDPAPPVVKGKNKNKKQRYKLLFDWATYAKYADEWPQVSKIVGQVSDTH